jgi:3-oxoacyl-[acyl-carrier protein] reductase
VIDTDMNRSHLSDEDLEVLRNEIPAGRMGTPEEVADMTLKIITSPEYMTGQIITLDGGWI